MAFGDQDLAVFVREGVPATDASGNTANVILEWPEEVEMFHGHSTAGVVVGKPTILFATGSLILKNAVAVTVNGVGYVVCHTWQVTDGKFSKAELQKVGA